MRIISILGGPGSGKGTQCALLQAMFSCAHLSVGDVMRAEAAKPDSPYASIIEENMRYGRVGPKEITVEILKRHMENALKDGVETFFLDGFPRKLDQAEFFEQEVGPIDLVIVFDCPQSVLVQRLSQRNRADDDEDNIKRRIETFKSTTSLVLDKYIAVGKVVNIDTNMVVDEVVTRLQHVLEEHNVVLKPRS